jgi:hypothetical protein
MAHVTPFQCSASAPELVFPTAVHAVADVHETAERAPPAGVRWTAHLLPFQRSARAPESVRPTAVHAAADVHETAERKPPAGVRRMAQRLPFHVFARFPPTALHFLAAAQDTPNS